MGRDFDAGRGLGPGRGAAARGRAQRAVRQPAHRGQPAVLLPDHRPHVRPQRRMARVVAPLDCRGSPALDRAARLHDRHPVARPADARGRPHDADVGRRRSPTRTRRSTVSSTSRCRSWPPASPTATPAGRCIEHLGEDHPVAKAGYDVISRVAADENFHFLFYRDLTSAALEIAPSLVAAGHRAPGARVRDARHRHPRLQASRRAHRPARVSTTCRSTTRRSSSRWS